jgi:hypothetical protein
VIAGYIRIGKEVVMTYFEVVFQNGPVEIAEGHDSSQPERSVIQPRL